MINSVDSSIQRTAFSRCQRCGTSRALISSRIRDERTTRSLPRNKLCPGSQTSLLPRGDGTYLITGGLRVLGPWQASLPKRAPAISFSFHGALCPHARSGIVSRTNSHRQFPGFEHRKAGTQPSKCFHWISVHTTVHGTNSLPPKTVPLFHLFSISSTPLVSCRLAMETIKEAIF